MSKENSELKLELQFLCEEMKLLTITAHSRKPFSFTSIANDRQMRFFTAIQNMSVFNALHSAHIGEALSKSIAQKVEKGGRQTSPK